MASKVPAEELEPMEKPFYTLSTEQVAAELQVSIETGLSDEDAGQRLDRYGPNVLSGSAEVSIWMLLLKQLANSMTVVLFAAAALSIATKDYAEAVVVVLIIIANTFIGLYQEFKAEKTMAALRSISSPTSNVLRNGEQKTIPTIELVPGDILLLKNGDSIGADCRLIQSQILSTDEALLTGETHPVEKHCGLLADNKVPLGDQYNMGFSGTNVTQGRGRGIVVRTGMKSELGKIAKSMFESKARDSETPLQRSLSRMGLLLLFISLGLALIVFAVNEFKITVSIMLYAVAVGIAVIPEGLVAVVTLTMAMGMRQMSKQRVLVRKLVALELLGRVTNVCSDKTGTLTQAIMTVTTFWLPSVGVQAADANTGTSSQQLLVKCSALCNMAEIKLDDQNRFRCGIGDPTEIALQRFAHQQKLGKKAVCAQDDFSLWVEHTFDSNHKRMSVVYGSSQLKGAVVFAKGATEKILERCAFIRRGDQVAEITYDDLSKEVLPIVLKFSSQGMRTIALAMRFLGDVGSADAARDLSRVQVESNLTFLGLIGINDPPRPESKQSVAQCYEAGIVVHMLTGDHPLTAVAIAREIGILPPLDDDVPNDEKRIMLDDSKALVMTSTEFDGMTDNQIDALESLPVVIARCSPKTKVRMIEALHRRGKIVAMTGDGVNDAPSLKLADVGLAMGQNSSDVAKEAAEIVLTDNNFASIVTAIAEGRRIFCNIQRFVAVLIGGNMAELFALMVGLVFADVNGHSVFPLSPIQILVNNMVTGTPSALALGMEKASPDAMKQPPRSASLGLFDFELIADIIFFGSVIGAISLVGFHATVSWFGSGVLASDCDMAFTDQCADLYRARGVVFAVLTVLMLLHTYNCRDIRGRTWTLAGIRRMFDNPSITNAVVIGCAIAIVSLYVPGVNNAVFKQLPIAIEWTFVSASIAVFMLISDLYKIVKSYLISFP